MYSPSSLAGNRLFVYEVAGLNQNQMSVKNIKKGFRITYDLRSILIFIYYTLSSLVISTHIIMWKIIDNAFKTGLTFS